MKFDLYRYLTPHFSSVVGSSDSRYDLLSSISSPQALQHRPSTKVSQSSFPSRLSLPRYLPSCQLLRTPTSVARLSTKIGLASAKSASKALSVAFACTTITSAWKSAKTARGAKRPGKLWCSVTEMMRRKLLTCSPRSSLSLRRGRRKRREYHSAGEANVSEIGKLAHSRKLDLAWVFHQISSDTRNMKGR